MSEKNLNHIDSNGNAVMVDVSAKDITTRTAVAKGRIKMQPATFAVIKDGQAKKGDVLAVAQIAGIMASKKTSELIPLCHPLSMSKATVEFNLLPQTAEIEVICSVKTDGKTGVEMEALTGATVALLTIYDMCKAIDRAMTINEVCLWQKQGGKSGDYLRGENEGLDKE